MANTVTIQNAEAIIDEALSEANRVAKELYESQGDGYPCGFAWVEVKKVRKNSILGKVLISKGFKPSEVHRGVLRFSNPSGLPVQNMNIKEEAAYTFAKILRDKLGISAWAYNRLD